MYVLRGPASTIDPMLPTSQFTFVTQDGLIANLPPDQWPIDRTVFTLNGQLYLVHSGWPAGTDGLEQQLFIAKMTNLYTADASAGILLIAKATFPWEKYQDPGNGPLHQINEGPAWLEIDAFKGIVFSGERVGPVTTK